MNKNLSALAVAVALGTAPMAAVQAAEWSTHARVMYELASISGDVGTNSEGDDESGLVQAESGQGRLQFDAKSEVGFARIAMDKRLGRDKAKCSFADTDASGDIDSASCSSSSGATFRDMYVGIKLGPGKLSFGRQAGAIKNLEKDPLIATILQARGSAAVHGGSYGSSSFISGMAQYALDAGGWKIKVQLNPQTDTMTVDGDSAVGGKGGDAGLSAKGKAGPVTLWLGWNNGGGGDDDLANTKLGASMKAGPTNLTLNYNSKEAPDGGDADDRIFLDANMKFGDWTGDVALGSRSHGDASGTMFRLGGITSLDKQTRLHVGFRQDSYDSGVTGSDEVSTTAVGFGLLYKL